MILTKLILFLFIWSCLMAIPLKLGLLPGRAASLERARSRIQELMSPLWLRFLPPDHRANANRDLETKAALSELLDRYAPTAEQLDPFQQDDVPRLRPEVAARVVKLHRTAMILGLGSFAQDVYRTLGKARSQAHAGLLDAAHLQLMALRGRISAHNHFPSDRYGYYPYVHPHPPINEVAETLNCGLGTQFLADLDDLCRVSLEEADLAAGAIVAVCSNWLNHHQDRAVAVANYVERYAGRVKTHR